MCASGKYAVCTSVDLWQSYEVPPRLAVAKLMKTACTPLTAAHMYTIMQHSMLLTYMSISNAAYARR